MRASEFIIEPGSKLLGKLSQSGKIVQILKQTQGPAFAKDKDEVWTLIDTEPGKYNKTSTTKWIPGDTEFEWAREFLSHNELDEGVKDWLAGIATVGALIFGAPDANAVTQQQYNQTVQMLSSTPAQILKKAAVASGITGNELAQFMAQCAHETAGFSTMKEQGGSLDFKKYDIKHNPRKAKALGNVKPGDGARYHGRGFIQLTGRDNYKRAGRALGLPLEQRPELVERPDVAAKVAVWFWKNHVTPKVSSYHDTAQVTKPINPAMRGLKDRDTKFQAIKQGAMARSNQIAPRGTKI